MFRQSFLNPNNFNWKYCLPFCLFLFLTSPSSGHPSASKEWNLNDSWIVSPKQAIRLTAGGAKLLDARHLKDRIINQIQSATVVSWEDFSIPDDPNKGILLPIDLLQRKFKKIGIQKNDVILVFGDPLSGWGEEGRIVWTLRAAEFLNAYLVDGGADRYLQLFKEKANNMSIVKKETTFKNKNEISIDISAEELKNRISLKKKDISVLDVREEREYRGKTPYGESRGGHIPGAKWIYYKEFMDPEGYIKPKEQILEILKSKNIKPEDEIVSYCTGGIRSAFTTSVLNSYGFRAKNFSGSMWEWSSKDSNLYPLVKEKSE